MYTCINWLAVRMDLIHEEWSPCGFPSILHFSSAGQRRDPEWCYGGASRPGRDRNYWVKLDAETPLITDPPLHWTAGRTGPASEVPCKWGALLLLGLRKKTTLPCKGKMKTSQKGKKLSTLSLSSRPSRQISPSTRCQAHYLCLGRQCSPCEPQSFAKYDHLPAIHFTLPEGQNQAGHFLIVCKCLKRPWWLASFYLLETGAIKKKF